MGQAGPSWYTVPSGLFSADPHVILEEHYWNSDQKTANRRIFVIDAKTGNVIRYAQTFQAYNQADYQQLLVECGFGEVCFYPSLTGLTDPEQEQLLAITAVKK
jgi:hypothetical protein